MYEHTLSVNDRPDGGEWTGKGGSRGQVSGLKEETMKNWICGSGRRVFCIFAFLALSHGLSGQEYTIDSSVTFYNRSLRKVEGRISYYPGQFGAVSMSEVVTFTFADPFGATGLLYGRRSETVDLVNNLRAVIDKCLEWAGIAKANNVTELTKEIDGPQCFETNVGSNWYDPCIVRYIFTFVEEAGKKTPFLVINFRTTDQANQGSPGGFVAFSEKDFARLRDILSEQNLAQYDQRDAENRKKAELFN
jgi:hypothetical protein